MASEPSFAGTILVGAAVLGLPDLNLITPVIASTIIPDPGADGCRVDEIIIRGVGNTVAGLVNLFLHDGSAYHLIDQLPVALGTPSATVAGYVNGEVYANLCVPAGWTLRASNTIAGNNGTVEVVALGASV